MDLNALIRGRRTVHDFEPRPVDEDVVKDALMLGLWAPNHKLTRPVRYVWVGPDVRARLIDLACEIKGATDAKKRASIAAKMNGPAHLILLAIKRAEREVTRHEDYATLAAAVQNVSLALWARGIGTKWSSAAWSTDPRAFDILGLDPHAFVLEGCLMIGWPSVVPSPPPRPDLDQALIRLA